MKSVSGGKDGAHQRLTLRNELLAILLLFCSLFLSFSLISYHPEDRSFFVDPAHDLPVANFGGRIGAEVSALLLNLVGWGALLLVLYLFFLTAYFFLNRSIPSLPTKTAGFVIATLAFAAFMALVAPGTPIPKIRSGGGLMGFLLGELLSAQIKPFFAALFYLIVLFLGVMMVVRFSLRKVFMGLLRLLWRGICAVGFFVRSLWEMRQRRKEIRRIEAKHNLPVEPAARARRTSRKKTPRPEELPTEQALAVTGPGQGGGSGPEKPRGAGKGGMLFDPVEEEVVGHSGYQPPPMTYLDAPTGEGQIDVEELGRKRLELAGRLEEFRVKGEIREFQPGPVVTTYEFVPDTGVKVKDVTNMAEDLALVVKAQYVRIERVLGKKAIGIEVPNRKREIIRLREILESEEYRRSHSPLTVGLGKSKSGEIFITDLREMPHLIVAGATGSGKSVAIHTILLSILYKASPERVKFILIDPKCVELAAYNTLPHLLTPVVTNMKLAKNALDWAVYEMEQRYQLLARMGVRNIEQFNKKLEMIKTSGEEEDDALLEEIGDPGPMAYIVIIIDEFADLMMVSAREVEESVARIAQKARAVGIHLIVATQRPSTDVITGTIKNNFPCRIALAVPSKFDSRTIIDGVGAEKLLGMGDMLFLPPKTASLVRVHCAYVSEEEAHRVVKYLAKVEKPQFNGEVVKPRLGGEGRDGGENDLDELFAEAARLVIEAGTASASFLQRRLSVGYARAGRLVDQLEARGVVSAPNSRSQREILMTQEEALELLAGGGEDGEV